MGFLKSWWNKGKLNPKSKIHEIEKKKKPQQMQNKNKNTINVKQKFNKSLSQEQNKNKTRLWQENVPKTNVEQTKSNENSTFIYTSVQSQ
jgi:hypothetical protein